jgi:hypothetical protein
MKVALMRFVLVLVILLLGAPGGAAYAALAVDGTTTGACNTTKTTCAATGLTTASTNDIIILFVAAGSLTTTPPTLNVPTATGLTFTLRGSTSGNTSTNNGMILSEYYAIASATQSSKIITATTTSAADTITMVAFGVSGGNTSTPFDTHSGLPASAQNLTATGSTVVITGFSTSNANDMIIASAMAMANIFASMPGNATSYTAGPFVNNSGASTFAPTTSEYDIVSASQSSVSVGWATGGAFDSTVRWFMMADAIQQASAGVTAVPGLALTGAGK